MSDFKHTTDGDTFIMKDELFKDLDTVMSELGWTHQQLFDYLGLSRTTWWRIRTGKKELSAINFIEIVLLLHADPWDYVAVAW